MEIKENNRTMTMTQCIIKNCENITNYKGVPCKECRHGGTIARNSEAIKEAKERWSQWAKENPNKVKTEKIKDYGK